MTSTNVPVLFIIFSQPEVTEQVFAAIRSAQPKHLFIAADGPRLNHHGEAEDCTATRSIVSNIDWECDCRLFFRPENVGCRTNVSEAITWFLDAMGEGIILEYDCLPHPSFFKYCEVLLDRYRNDSRIMSICGSDLQFGNRRGDGDYFFARLPNTWGWATWKRAWLLWEGDLKSLPQFVEEKQIENSFNDKDVQRHLLAKFDDVFAGRNRTTWGFAWVYAHLAHNALTIFPSKNLISNLGFSKKATHAIDEKSIFSRIPLIGISEFRKPTFEIPCREADQYVVHLATYVKWNRKLALLIRKNISYLIPRRIRVKLRFWTAKFGT